MVLWVLTGFSIMGCSRVNNQNPLTAEQISEETRIARLSEMNAQTQGLDVNTLSCRYVSGISSAPPAKRIALTFDDGPDQNGTLRILEVLNKYNLHATFFMVGRSAEANMDLVQKVYHAGHLIVGSHSWSHPNFHNISAAKQTQEIESGENLLGQYQNPKLFRYPYGNSTCESNSLLHSLGYKIVGWHVDSCDWAFNKTGSVSSVDAKICDVSTKNIGNFVGHVVDSIHKRNGGIILMHEVQPISVRNLDKIIQQLLKDGFTFGSLDENEFQTYLK
jgi:peptidoglycan/xylan/chitin deacetylase (PgdA/CDA1 family)